MSERHRERAQKVVESFRELLDEKVRGVIPENDFEQLTIFVQEALADELHDAAEQACDCLSGFHFGSLRLIEPRTDDQDFIAKANLFDVSELTHRFLASWTGPIVADPGFAIFFSGRDVVSYQQLAVGITRAE